MIKIRLTGFWEEDHFLLPTILKKYNQGNSTFKNILFVNDNTYDKVVILSKPHENFGEYDEKKAVTIMTEPPIQPYINSHKTSQICPMYLPLPFLPNPILGKQEFGGNGDTIAKDKLFSIITSDLYLLEGHKQRLLFASILDKIIGNKLDFFGKRFNNIFFNSITSYRGEIKDKYLGLWKYQYHFACENHFITDYFTEKIIDPIIAECLCFYSGCLNLFEYIDERAYIYLDLNNIENSIETILEAINNNERKKRLKYIREQKLRCLTTLNPINIIYMLVNDQDVIKKCRL